MMWNWNEYCLTREMSSRTKMICVSNESYVAMMRGAKYAIYNIRTHTLNHSVYNMVS